MRILDVLLGRTRVARPNLDDLFAVPSAALGLEASLGFTPTGVGAVCFAAAEGKAAAQAQTDALALVNVGAGNEVTTSVDQYGYAWIRLYRTDRDLAALLTDLHAINITLAENGYGPLLLATVIGFAGTAGDTPRRLNLVYLFKQGTFYPFAPSGSRTRDTTVELQVRAQLSRELPVEPDLGRWFAIWDSPV